MTKKTFGSLMALSLSSTLLTQRPASAEVQAASSGVQAENSLEEEGKDAPPKNGQIQVGGSVAFGTESNVGAGFNVNGYYGLEKALRGLRVGAEFTYFFAEDPLTLWSLDFNGHYRFVESGSLGAYAIGGLNVTRASVEVFGIEASDTDLGLNVGIGGQYEAVDRLNLYAEVKYVLSSFDQAVLGAGARYSF